MTDNDVDELFRPNQLSLLESGLVGIGVNRRFGPDLDVPFGSVRFEAEAQLVRHFGLQHHWEVNLPVGFRFTPRRRLAGIDSIGFGVGASFASEIPPIELRRGRGSGARELIYFHVELEHALSAYPGTRVFFRVHHRSDGYGTVARAVGTNALAIGIRRSF